MYLQTSAISYSNDSQSKSKHRNAKGQLRHSGTPIRVITQDFCMKDQRASQGKCFNATDISIVWQEECHHADTAESAIIKCPSDGIFNWINSVNGSS